MLLFQKQPEKKKRGTYTIAEGFPPIYTATKPESSFSLAKAWARSLSKNSKKVGAIEPENNAKRNEISGCISVTIMRESLRNNLLLVPNDGSVVVTGN